MLLLLLLLQSDSNMSTEVVSSRSLHCFAQTSKNMTTKDNALLMGSCEEFQVLPWKVMVLIARRGHAQGYIEVGSKKVIVLCMEMIF